LLQRINVQMPRRVLERFRSSTFVAFSTGCVYPFVTPSTGGATEDTPPQPKGEYAASCLAREKAFDDASRQLGTKATLIRLNYSVEFRYGLLVDIALKVLRGEPVDVTTGYANVIWQTDALNTSIQALDLAAAPAAPLNVTGPDTLSVREVATRFGELLGRSVHLVGQESDTAWLNNAARAHRRFGPPATALDTMLRYVAAWLASGGAVWDKPTGFEKRDGNF
jgi:nucleoside-diphosphate-sugar epimerase